MKKLILTTLVALTSVSLFGQGTVVFQNWQANPFISKPITMEDGSSVPLDTYTAGLYYAAAGTTDRAAFTLVSELPVGVPIAGLWRPPSGASSTPLENIVVGTDAALFVRAWENGLNYDTSPTKGESAIWTQPTGGAGNPPSLPVSIVTYFEPFQIVPEPSAIALGLLGAGALLLLRRRK